MNFLWRMWEATLLIALFLESDATWVLLSHNMKIQKVNMEKPHLVHKNILCIQHKHTSAVLMTCTAVHMQSIMHILASHVWLRDSMNYLNRGLHLLYRMWKCLPKRGTEYSGDHNLCKAPKKCVKCKLLSASVPCNRFGLWIHGTVTLTSSEEGACLHTAYWKQNNSFKLPALQLSNC